MSENEVLVQVCLSNDVNLFLELSKYIGKRLVTACKLPEEYRGGLVEGEWQNWGGDCGILQSLREEAGVVFVIAEYGLEWAVWPDNVRIWVTEIL